MMDIPSGVIATIRANARLGSTAGREPALELEQAYEASCAYFHYASGTMVDLLRVFARPATDSPFYLRRYIYLSLSFRETRIGTDPNLFGNLTTLADLGMVLGRAPFDRAVAIHWVRALLAPFQNRAWWEPGESGEDDEKFVLHLRLFCNEEWEPIAAPPDYAAQLRRRGWLTWNELQAGWSDTHANEVGRRAI